MTRYFMRDTPLYQMEQMMMTRPISSPEVTAYSRPTFHYQSEDVDCQYCTNYSKENPCRCVNALAWGNESRPGRSALRK